MESLKNYNKNARGLTKLSGPLPLLAEVPPTYLRSILCQPQHVGVLLLPSELVGPNRRVHRRRSALLGESGESLPRASQGSEQLVRHAGQRSEQLLRNDLGPTHRLLRIVMQRPVKERVANLREEISRIREANRKYVEGGKKTFGEVDHQRRLQRLQEILDELASLTDWKQP